MSKVHYLNSHLDKYREKSKITIVAENIRSLADYNILGEEDKKTTKIFTKCFKNKETYKELLKKLPNNVDRLGKFYLITAYWIAFTCHYHNDKFDEAMEECLESIDEYVILLNSPHFCKKVYYYLNPIGEVK
jgi:hypoxanthine phosphoribosyltransferase